MDQRLQDPAVEAPPDWRGLCEELTEHLALLDEPPHELVCRAQEALAQPEPEVGPTDEELLATLDKATADFPPRHPEAEALNAVEYPLALELRKARAVLARWGRPAPAPAGEVADETRYSANVLPRMIQAPDWRGLCEELLRELENAIAVHYGEGGTHHISAADAVIARADAALAQPEPEVLGPTDGEPPLGPFSEHDLRQQWNQQADEFNQWDSLGSDEQLEWAQACAIAAHRSLRSLAQAEHEGPSGDEIYKLALEGDFLVDVGDGFTCMVQDEVGFARAVLARWGRSGPAPAGEVAWLVAWLRDKATWHQADEPEATLFDRAADLLERQAAPVPVAVSERLPGSEDCDAEGFCWWFSPADPSAGTFGVAACWVLRKPEPEDDFRTHWLPAHALPLPSGEVAK